MDMNREDEHLLQSIEEHEMNMNESDDDLLLSVPSNLTFGKQCRHYCVDIYVLLVIIMFSSIFLFSGVFFIKALNTRVVLRYPISDITCTEHSQTGKSCMTRDVNSTLLINVNLKKVRYRQHDYNYYSSEYLSKSDGSIITFHCPSGSRACLDDISFYDTRNKLELIENGGFENGNLHSYCLCDSLNYRTRATETSAYKGSFGCEIYSRFSVMKFSQLVNTTFGRLYNVSFWYKGLDDFTNEMRVYITPAYSQLEYHTRLLE